jgi:penicillin-insensitive murein endopeptidase
MLPLALLALLVAAAGWASDVPSRCHGTTTDGSLENGWKLRRAGENFSAYSTLGALLGRTYVHSKVHGIVLDAYAALHESHPELVFVYGETGFEDGGEFKPHKTHRNGLSVDFMVPVRDGDERSVPLPTHVGNKWGYDIEFDEAGAFDDLHIDFEAMALHIYQLDVVARAHGVGIWRVIFAPELQPHLHGTTRWPDLKDRVKFSTRPSWVRHDEHYHVDFEVECD